TVPANDLRMDPVLQIAQQRQAGITPLNRLALSLANWEDTTASTVALAEFDLARQRFLLRLGPSSLRESWVRWNLLAPPAAKGAPFSSVLANAPSDEPGGLGRPEALARAYNPKRTALPPAVANGGALSLVLAPDFLWNPGSILLFDTDTSGSSQ